MSKSYASNNFYFTFSAIKHWLDGRTERCKSRKFSTLQTNKKNCSHISVYLTNRVPCSQYSQGVINALRIRNTHGEGTMDVTRYDYVTLWCSVKTREWNMLRY
jgi:hypothetical protein